MDTYSNQKQQSTGYALDPETCDGMNFFERRKLIREIAENSSDAPEVLRSFTRRELLEIICCEMGKERKYTGYSKSQMIELLLRLISKSNAETPVPRVVVDDEEVSEFRVCENVACRASLSSEAPFCKRCSCCACHRYDDNKDPSLWLTCDSDSDTSCGMSCHLECALEHERSGFLKKDARAELDGSFYCVSCGKVNDVMRTWRKQLIVARDTRRVDALCLRLSLCHKILIGTERFKEVHEMVEGAVNAMNEEVGPLDHVCAKMSRGIVNRLSCGTRVQRMCSSALECFDSAFPSRETNSTGTKQPMRCRIEFEELSATSVTIVLEYEDRVLNGELGCRLWHRKCDAEDYPEQPSFIVLKPQKRFEIRDLEPSAEYLCKVSLLSSRGVLGAWEAKWLTLPLPLPSPPAQNHSGAESSTNSRDDDDPLRKRKRKSGGGADVPATPRKSERASRGGGGGGGFAAKRSEESDYEYSVRAVKWLEDHGHVEADFRVKFLTWFSLKASKQERRVVSVFVDAFALDLPSLAGQLVHTFTDKICVKDCNVEPRHALSLLFRK